MQTYNIDSDFKHFYHLNSVRSLTSYFSYYNLWYSMLTIEIHRALWFSSLTHFFSYILRIKHMICICKEVLSSQTVSIFAQGCIL